jgi:Kef-type K+ transport system membrane component KefB
MRRRLGATVGIGAVSFAGPFVVASLIAYLALDWSGKASLIGGTALSTTSLAVVYAVLVERGLTASDIGKLLMSATFVTDLLTALALSLIFIKPSPWFPLFLAISVGLIVALPRVAPWFFGRYGDRVIEPEIKLVFFCLLVLMVLAAAANGHAVLPAFVLGLMMSNHYSAHREEQKRLRVVAFAMLTPFFFIKGGLNVSLSAVFSNLGVLGVLLAAKMVPKLALVYPVIRRADQTHATFGTLLMSTGLTFGTIASIYGLTSGIIDTTQFSLLVTVVVLSAIVPTAIAERWFLPVGEGEPRLDRRHAYEASEEFV